MKRNVSKYIIASLFFLFALLTATLLYYANIKNEAESFTTEAIISAIRAQLTSFDLNLEQQSVMLNIIAAELSEETDLNDLNQVSRKISEYKNLYNLSSLCLIKQNGKAFSDNNTVYDMPPSMVKELFLQNKKCDMGIRTPEEGEDPSFFITVPVIKKGQTEAYLYAQYKSADLKQLFIVPYVPDMCSGLIASNGTSVSTSPLDISGQDVIDQLCSDVSGFLNIQIDSIFMTFYHLPTSAPDTFFFMAIPTRSIDSFTFIISRHGFSYAIIILIISVLLLIFTYHSERKQKHDVIRLSKKLKQSEARYQNAFLHTDNVAWEYEISTKTLNGVTKHKDGTTSVLKFSDPENTLVQDRIIHPEFTQQFKEFCQQMRKDPPYASCILKLRHNNGSYYWARLSFIVATDDESNGTVLGLAEDISDVKEAQDKYAQEKQTLAAMTANSVSYFLIDLKKDMVLEKKCRDDSQEHMATLTDRRSLINSFINNTQDKADRQKFAEYLERTLTLETISSDKPIEEFEYKRKSPLNGTIEWINFSVTPIRSFETNETTAAIRLQNIDNRKKQEMLLQRRAERDLLTDLYNKMTMSSLINDYLKESADINSIDALIMLDADNYKSINDTFGHVFGDKVLIEIADSLRSSVKQCDLVGRIGGDEFMVFLKNLKTKEDIISILNRISEGIQHTYIQNDNEVTISASIGVAYVTSETKSFMPLYKLADTALYDAKAAGKNCYRFAEQ